MSSFRNLLGLLCLVATVNSSELKEEFTWNFINYNWPENATDCQESEAASDEGSFVFPSDPPTRENTFKFYNRMTAAEEDASEYIAENNIPMGANRYKDRIFITVPRRRLGIPGTLNYVNLNCKTRHNVPLTPYPSWELNALGGRVPGDATDVNTPIVSVYRTTVDRCDRLWFVDIGILEYPTGRQQVQQGALVIVDLKTNKIIRRYPFKPSDANALSTLADVTVDVTQDTCGDAFAYIPDLVNYRMIVYSFREQDSWAISHNSFYLNPRGGEFHIGGFDFQWNDGVFSVSLSAVNPKDGYRTAYYHAMASTEEFAVSTRVLRNRTLATRSYHGNDFKFVGDRGANGQSSTHDIHQPSGVMFLGEVNKNALTCWSTNTPFSKANQAIVHQDAARMIYPGDVRVDLDDNVLMMTNSMPVFLYGHLDYQMVNFRIWMNTVREATKGTPCHSRH